MTKTLIAGLALALLSGCSGITGGNIGTRTTHYDHEGRVTAMVEDTALGDPTEAYYGAVRTVAGHSSASIQARAAAIQTATAPQPTDSDDAQAWKAAFGALAIATIQDPTAENIAAVEKATTGYDIGMEVVGTVKTLGTVGLPVWGAVEAVKTMSRGMGDRTTVTTQGEGNATRVETTKTTLHSDVRTSNTGDESHPVVSVAPAASTPMTQVFEAAEPVVEIEGGE